MSAAPRSRTPHPPAPPGPRSPRPPGSTRSRRPVTRAPRSPASRGRRGAGRPPRAAGPTRSSSHGAAVGHSSTPSLPTRTVSNHSSGAGCLARVRHCENTSSATAAAASASTSSVNPSGVSVRCSHRSGTTSIAERGSRAARRPAVAASSPEPSKVRWNVSWRRPPAHWSRSAQWSFVWVTSSPVRRNMPPSLLHGSRISAYRRAAPAWA